MKIQVKRLCVSALFIALSTVLSLIKVVQMPLGGSVTLLSMLPVSLIGILYGTKFALGACLLYGLIQTFLGGALGWGLTPAVLVACLLLDYLLAYGSLCLSGIFGQNKKWGVIAGVSLACFVRFLCHFVSGVVLWKSFEVFNNPYVYSLCYNGAYMLPELVFTVLGTFLLSKTNSLSRLV